MHLLVFTPKNAAQRPIGPFWASGCGHQIANQRFGTGAWDKVTLEVIGNTLPEQLHSVVPQLGQLAPRGWRPNLAALLAANWQGMTPSQIAQELKMFMAAYILVA